MKVTFEKYGVLVTEISITVKDSGKEKATKKATLEYLNELSIIYHEAANSYRAKGLNALARDAEEKSKQLYNLLNDQGLYDGV